MVREERDPGGAATSGKGVLKSRIPRAPKKASTSKVGKSSGKKHTGGRSARAKSSGAWREAVGAGGGKQTGHLPAGGHLAGGGLLALELADLGGGAVSGAGLGDVLLDLVGEGQVRLSHALRAWQGEQDRVANRAWRRPGGMARMGGL